ncbi:hypothetical protein FB446DRAFT_790972 [Lentinula raphanica]|nr:hypothetical protein FB446DRAFT_790972 [Lentinula raphanica]
MASGRARRTSRRRTNQDEHLPRPSYTMALRSATRKSQGLNATITSKPTTAISTPTPAVTSTAAGESNLLPVFHSSIDLLSHDTPPEARMLSNLASLDTAVTSEVSSSLSEPDPSIDASDPISHTDTNAYMHDLPPKPLIPLELPTTDPYVKRLEMVSASATHLFDKQEASIKSTNEYIELLTQLCIDYKEIRDSKQAIERIDHICWSCKELAWNPHVLRCGHVVCAQCITNARRLEIETGKTCQCPTCRFPVRYKPIPSVAIQTSIERIAFELNVIPPAHRHLLEWPDL